MIYTVRSFPNAKQVPWDAVPRADISVFKWEPTRYPTFAKLIHVPDMGFICKMRCEQSDPWAECTENGGKVWLDSAMEFFFSFGEEGYVNMECNALGAYLANFGTSRHGRVPVIDRFRAEAVRHAESWEVTFTLPMESLRSLFPSLQSRDITTGFTFRGNFYKTGTHPRTGDEHYGMWNEINSETPDFHRPEQFGTLRIA